MTNIEKQYAKALTKTLHAYEELMADIPGNVEKWHHYGSSHSCRMCRLKLLLGHKCYQCPLGGSDVGMGCGESDPVGHTVRDLMCELSNYPGNQKPLSRAIEARYKSILRVIRRNGWTYE